MTVSQGDGMLFAANIGLAACWCAWWYPFLFRAPHYQKRGSMVATAPTLLGLALEVSAYLLAFAFRLHRDHPPGMARIVASMAFGPAAAILAWSSVKNLGRQFRIRAGLYEDHELVRTGPYGLVRHPIYASMLAILVSTLLLLTRWPWTAISLALFAAGTEIRVRVEDKLLASRFGADFEEYRKAVRAYIPFVR